MSHLSIASKRGKANTDPPVTRGFIHPLLRARDWQERAEFNQLCDWWRKGGSGLCSLVGIGGAGKTAIVERFVRSLPGVFQGHHSLAVHGQLLPPTRLFIYSFYNEPTPDSFLCRLHAWLENSVFDALKPVPSYEKTLELFRKAIDPCNASLLMVLDGLEKIQNDATRGGVFGRIEDGRLRDLLERLADGWLPGVSAVLTTRFRLSAPFATARTGYTPICVERLPLEACVALLRARGVVHGSNRQLEQMAKDYGCHALSLDLIGGFVSRFCGGDPLQVVDEPHTHFESQEMQDAESLDPEIESLRAQEKRFARVALRYYDALQENDPASLALLQRICLFRLGVDCAFLQRTFTGAEKSEIAGHSLSRLTASELRKKLRFLNEMRLIESGVYSTGTDKVSHENYTIHPAVRDGFLRTLTAQTANLGHEAVRQSLIVSLKESPQTKQKIVASVMLDMLEEVIHHSLKSKHFKEAWSIYWDQLGNYKHLGAHLGAFERGERICRSLSSAEELNMADKFNLSADWARFNRDVGNLSKAVAIFESATNLLIQNHRWETAGKFALELAATRLLTGQFEETMTSIEDANRYFRESGDALGRSEALALRGLIKSLQGNIGLPAEVDFDNALHCQRINGHMRSLKYLRNAAGIWHALHLAKMGVWEKVKGIALQTKRQPEQLLRAKCNLLLSQCACADGDIPRAFSFFRIARDWAVVHDAREIICWSALVRAKIFEVERTSLKDSNQLQMAFEDASRHVSSAVFVARSCGYAVYLAELTELDIKMKKYAGAFEVKDHGE